MSLRWGANQKGLRRDKGILPGQVWARRLLALLPVVVFGVAVAGVGLAMAALLKDLSLQDSLTSLRKTVMPSSRVGGAARSRAVRTSPSAFPVPSKDSASWLPS